MKLIITAVYVVGTLVASINSASYPELSDTGYLLKERLMLRTIHSDSENMMPRLAESMRSAQEAQNSIPAPSLEQPTLNRATEPHRGMPLFEMIIEAEAHPEWSVDGYLLIAQTVRNQLESGKYGRNYVEVLTRKGNYTVYSNGRYKQVSVTDNAREAVSLVMNGSNRMNYGQLYFCTVSHLQKNPNGLHGRSEEVYRYKNVVFVK